MQRRPTHAGFTLIEVMVSIGIALLLMLGINVVFSASSKTVGAGNAVLESSRQQRTVGRTMFNDLNNLDPVPSSSNSAPDGPCFVIRSDQVYAFRDAQEQSVASDPIRPKTDSVLYTDAVLFPFKTVPIPLINTRNHRLDRLSFFARGLYPRQTSSNTTSFIQSTSNGLTESSGEAWITYGHAIQPNLATVDNNPTTSKRGAFSPGVYTAPSPTAPLNDTNFYSADWTLARQAILLLPAIPTADNKAYFPDAGNSANSLAPLAFETDDMGNAAATAQVGSGNTPYTVGSSRIDLAQTSIAFYNTKLSRFANDATTPTNPTWYDALTAYRPTASPYVLPIPSGGESVDNGKVNAFSLAMASPNLLRGCSQFIVEYTGNFYTKTADGTGGVADPSTPDPKGINDFYVDPGGTQHLRWYGFPRAVGSLNAYLNGSAATIALSSNNGDVVPLRDVIGDYADASKNKGGCERLNCNYLNAGTDYWQTTLTPPAAPQSPYVAAWGPDTTIPFPKMIRIIVGIDDPQGRINTPQLYEYVYTVQH